MSSYTLEAYPEDRFRLPPRRPTSVTVLAVLHLVFGGFGLLFGLCSGVMLAVGPVNFVPAPPPGAATKTPFPTDLAARQQRFLEQKIPYYKAITAGQIVVWLIFSGILIVAGIGLFGLRPWSRTLSIVGGIAAIVY
jgi:hypothetical protein